MTSMYNYFCDTKMKMGDKVTLRFEVGVWYIIEDSEYDEDDSLKGTIVCMSDTVTENLFDIFKKRRIEEWEKIFKDGIPQLLIESFKKDQELFIGTKLYCVHLDHMEEFGSNSITYPWFCKHHNNFADCSIHGPICHWDTCILYAIKR